MSIGGKMWESLDIENHQGPDGAPHLPASATSRTHCDLWRANVGALTSLTLHVQMCIVPRVPTGLKRFQETRDVHFVTFSCYRRQPCLTPAVRDLVVAALEQARRHYAFCVHGFVVMPEHVHLLVSEPSRALLANAIQSLKIASSRKAPVSPL